eukprot:Skav230088  [mRNA]  locus=scaffold1169:81426:89104:+ [translate_table: standard]
MASNISPWASTRTAISSNICAKSAMLCSSRRMSLCLSWIRRTSSSSNAWVPAIFLATISAAVCPSEINSCRCSSLASGIKICISRSWRCSKVRLKVICAF